MSKKISQILLIFNYQLFTSKTWKKIEYFHDLNKHKKLNKFYYNFLFKNLILKAKTLKLFHYDFKKLQKIIKIKFIKVN